MLYKQKKGCSVFIKDFPFKQPIQLNWIIIFLLCVYYYTMKKLISSIESK
jgi:hypothetical protein